MRPSVIFFSLLLCWSNLFALVKYDEGRLQIDGIQLLQDNEDPTAYYYIPQYPKLATKEDGSFEFLCIKYIGQGGAETNGGLFHALVEFSLPAEVVAELEKKLQDIVKNGKIVGPVPLQQVMDDGESGLARFKVVSSILSDVEGETAFTRSIITSGHAPFLPGSKAAIAAKLSQEGATLLWESFQGATSDVSVTLQGYYEAAVKGYNAVVNAEMSTVYEHYSRIFSQQEGYTKRQLRKISDELVQNQVLDIEVFDRSKALGIKADDMEGILNVITDKLVEIMFDAESGWAQKPEKETAVEQGQIEGRQKRGWFSRVFGGARDEKYVTDDQFVLKKREDIRVNKFYLNLSKSTTLKVPVYTSGNLGGLYDALGEDEKYFRVVNLDDPDFQKREIHFQVDAEFAESFKDILNFVSVSFKKSYGEGENDVTNDLIIKKDDLENGTSFKTISYPRLGRTDSDWLKYEYKISWSLKGSEKVIKIPKTENKWLSSIEPAVSLTPPFRKQRVEIDADRALFQETGVRSATVRFFVILDGKAQHQKTVLLRVGDAENSSSIALYHDTKEPILYQVSWYTSKGQVKEIPKELIEDYLFLVPPDIADE